MKWLIICLISALNASAASLYVDPDYTGGSNDGSAAHPWTSLTQTIWTNINTSLGTQATTVYFSALKADGTTQQSQAWFIEFKRWDYGTNRLAFDGFSFYNSNTTTPSWLANPQSDISVAYTNAKVFKSTGNGSLAVGWTRTSGQDFVTNASGTGYCCIKSHLSAAANQPGVGADWTNYWDQHSHTAAGATALTTSLWSSAVSYACLVRQDNITIRGFENTGSGARTGFNGDNLIFENVNVHDITTVAPAVAQLYHSYPDGSASEIISAPTTNVLLRNFQIIKTDGEALYVGASNPDSTTNFSMLHGNRISGFTVTNFIIRYPGINGEQGDGIDCKHGILGLHVVDGEIGWPTNTGNGINLPETLPESNQGTIIERLYIHDSSLTAGEGGMGIAAGTQGTGSGPFYGHSGLTIRNNLLVNCTGNNAISLGGQSPSVISNALIYNNTVWGGVTGFAISNPKNCVVKNNFVFSGNDLRLVVPATQVDSDYNAHDGSVDSPSEGAHSLALSTAQCVASVIATNPANFHVVSNSSIYGAGVDLSATFTVDLDRNTRTIPWDIGAYEYIVPSGPNLPGYKIKGIKLKR